MISFNKMIARFSIFNNGIIWISCMEVIFKANIPYRCISERNLLILLRNKAIISGTDVVLKNSIHFLRDINTIIGRREIEMNTGRRGTRIIVDGNALGGADRAGSTNEIEIGIFH